jgi:hypothetical protein
MRAPFDDRGTVRVGLAHGEPLSRASIFFGSNYSLEFCDAYSRFAGGGTSGIRIFLDFDRKVTGTPVKHLRWKSQGVDAIEALERLFSGNWDQRRN